MSLPTPALVPVPDPDFVPAFPAVTGPCPRQVCKAHLIYRATRLSMAKQNAGIQGHKGALYPWHSAGTGKEVCRPRHWIGRTDDMDWEAFNKCYHVNHAVFYNCWQYYQETNEIEFLEDTLLEVMLEIAMFWQSVAQYSDKDGR